MKITIIPKDGKVVVDGEGYSGLDLSGLDQSIHAVQWYDADGEVEVKDTRGRIVENREITSFSEFAFVIPLWEVAKLKAMQDAQAAADAMAAAEADAQAQQTP